MRMNLFFCWLDAGAGFDALCEFFTSAKPGDSLCLREEDIYVGLPDEPYDPANYSRCLRFIVRTADGYLVRIYNSDNDWRKFPEAEVNTGIIEVAKTEIVQREDVFRELMAVMPIQDVYSSFWCLINEADAILPKLYRLLIHKDGTLDFWKDLGFRGLTIRTWSKGGEFTDCLENVEFIGWYKGQLYALDYKEGLFALGVYDRSFLP